MDLLINLKKRIKNIFKLIFYIFNKKLNKCFTSLLFPSRNPCLFVLS